MGADSAFVNRSASADGVWTLQASPECPLQLRCRFLAIISNEEYTCMAVVFKNCGKTFDLNLRSRTSVSAAILNPILTQAVHRYLPFIHSFEQPLPISDSLRVRRFQNLHGGHLLYLNFEHISLSKYCPNNLVKVHRHTL